MLLHEVEVQLPIQLQKRTALNLLYNIQSLRQLLMPSSHGKRRIKQAPLCIEQGKGGENNGV